MVSDVLTLLYFLRYRALCLRTQNCGVQPTAVLFIREPFANSATGRQQYLYNILTAGYKRHNELKSQKLEMWSCFFVSCIPFPSHEALPCGEKFHKICVKPPRKCFPVEDKKNVIMVVNVRYVYLLLRKGVFEFSLLST